MFSLRLSILALMIYCTPLHAQDLTSSEVLSMRTYKLEKIDSLMLSKGFKKQVISEKKDQPLNVYTFRSASAQRSLIVGKPSSHVLELKYGMWQQTESDAFIRQLLHDGYKKSVTYIPDMNGKTKMEMISYKKGGDNISYQEKDQGNANGQKILLHIFSFSNENYR